MSKMRNFTRLRYFFTVFLLCFLISGYCAHTILNLPEGKSCPDNGDEIFSNSICRKIEDCPNFEVIKNEIKICSFEGINAIVCCPSTNNTHTANSTDIATSKPTVNPVNAVKRRTPAIRMCEKFANQTTTAECDAFSNNTGVASSMQFPHMVLIGYNLQPDDSAWGCMGSLISKRYVLTAARCIKKRYALAMKFALWARVGALDYVSNTNGAGGPSIDYKIDKHIKHPLYKPPSMYHDIGLLHLEKGVRSFTKFIRPICLNIKTLLGPVEIIATGWGHVDGTGPTSDRLLQVRGNTITAEQCEKNLRNMRRRNKQLPQGIVGDQMVCSENANDGKDTCAGFSGGPIHIKHERFECMYTQIGITSFSSGQFCEDKNSTTVYTLVSNYVSWIEPIVFPKKLKFSTENDNDLSILFE